MTSIRGLLRILDPTNAILAFKKLWSLDMQNKDLINVNEIKFNLVYSDTLEEGDLAWDSESGTLQIGMPGGNVKGQLLQEMHLPNRPKNIQGTQINNGQLVWGNSATGAVPEVKLANAALFSTSEGTIAMATEDVADQQRGYYTTFGLVNGIDTSLYTPGTKLYLSDTTDGEFTDVRPVAPSLPVQIGMVLRQHSTEGSVYVSIMVLKDEVVKDITKEPTGFTNPGDITSTYDSTTRTITLTGTVNAYWRGTPITELTNGWVSDPHSATLDQGYFLFYNGTNIIWSTTPWDFSYLPIAYVWYGTNNKFGIRETHGTMPWQDHKHGHETTGTYRAINGGGTLADYTLDSTTAADRRPSVTATTVNDEDLPTTVPSLSAEGNYTTSYLTSTSTNNFNTTATDIVPLSGNQPYFNEFTGGVYTQTLLGNNNYMCVWQVAVPVDADSGSQEYRYIWVQGQKEHPTLIQAQAETLADINLGDFTGLFTEFVFTNKLILRYTASNWSITEVSVLTGTRRNLVGTIATGVYLSNVTTDLTLTGEGTISNPLGISLGAVIEKQASFSYNTINEQVADYLFDNPQNIFNKSLLRVDDLNDGGDAKTYKIDKLSIWVIDALAQASTNAVVAIHKNGVTIMTSNVTIPITTDADKATGFTTTIHGGINQTLNSFVHGDQIDIYIVTGTGTADGSTIYGDVGLRLIEV